MKIIKSNIWFVFLIVSLVLSCREEIIAPENFVGKVIKKDVSRTATIEWGRNVYVKKYERYAKKRSRLRTHNPPCLKVAIGDEVMVARTRPLSKTKHYVIVKIIKKNETTKKPEVTEK